MIKAGRRDLVIQQGVKFETVITWYDSAGLPKNITGYTAKMQIREATSESEIITLSTENSRIVLGGAAGTITLTVTGATTTLLNFDNAEYDLRITSPAGVIYRLLQGYVVLDKQITTNEEVMTDLHFSSFQIAGMIEGGYDYIDKLLPMNVTITKIVITSRMPADGGNASIRIYTAAATGGTLKATVTILNGEYTGTWSGTEFLINNLTGERFVVHVTAGYELADLDVFIWYKV